MADPFGEDALVSLSELRDAKFMDKMTFACGKDFVIGQSRASNHKDGVLVESPPKQTILSPRKEVIPKPSPSPSPYKRNQEPTPSPSPYKRNQGSYKNSPSPRQMQQHQLSMKKHHHFVSREIKEESMEFNSPSQQSKIGDNLYQEQSISPSTPSGCAY